MSRKALSVLTLTFGVTSAAFGQTFVCPTGPGPGQRQVGMTGGGPGLASVPVCVQDAAPGGGGAHQSAPREDPATAAANAMVGLARAQAQQLNELNKLQQDPEFKKFAKGYWTYFYDTKNPKSGQHCMALFQNLEGAVQLTGPGSTYKGAMLTLLGLDVPKPTQPTPVKATLDQGDGKPQTLTAMNYTVGQSKVGAIAFAVPSIDAMVASMEDRSTFKVSVNGKQVVDTFFNDGLKARDRLRQCASGRPVK